MSTRFFLHFIFSIRLNRLFRYLNFPVELCRLFRYLNSPVELNRLVRYLIFPAELCCLCLRQSIVRFDFRLRCRSFDFFLDYRNFDLFLRCRSLDLFLDHRNFDFRLRCRSFDLFLDYRNFDLFLRCRNLIFLLKRRIPDPLGSFLRDTCFGNLPARCMFRNFRLLISGRYRIPKVVLEQISSLHSLFFRSRIICMLPGISFYTEFGFPRRCNRSMLFIIFILIRIFTWAVGFFSSAQCVAVI